MPRLTTAAKIEILSDYKNMRNPSMRQLAEKYGVSAMAIQKLLKANGVTAFKGSEAPDTGRHQEEREIPVSTFDFEDEGGIRAMSMDDFRAEQRVGGMADLSGSDEGPQYDSMVEDIHKELLRGRITKEQAYKRLKQLKEAFHDTWMG